MSNPSHIVRAGSRPDRSQPMKATVWPAAWRAFASLRMRESCTTSFETSMRIRIACSPEEFVHDRGDPGPGRPIPVRIRPVLLRIELGTRRFRNPRRVRAREDVRPDVQRLRTLHILAKGHAGHPEETALLLETARIREDEGPALLADEPIPDHHRLVLDKNPAPAVPDSGGPHDASSFRR